MSPLSVCEQCGAEVQRRRVVRFCSRRCYWDSQKGKPTPIPRHLLGGNRIAQANALRGRAQSAEHRRKRAESVAATLAKTLLTCVKCGEQFTPTRAAQKYCSGRCFNAVMRAKRAARPKLKISRAQYLALLEAVGHACEICGAKNGGTRQTTRLAIDHCHKTGEIRGVLCGRCNTALGLMRDSQDLLLRAIKYLRRKRT